MFISLNISTLASNTNRQKDMIFKDKDSKLTKIYFLICKMYQEELKYYCERFSNNNMPDFTDEEIMTIYLYVMRYEKHVKIKHIHRFAENYLKSWFPKIGSYQAFDNRLNKLHGAFSRLVEILITKYQPDDCCLNQNLLDSLPIITCSGKRSSKVAKEITDKGFCSTKGIFYYGLKMHLLGFRRKGKLPHPEQILYTPASVNDITVYKQAWCEINNRVFFGDKIYLDIDFNEEIKSKYNSEMLTPVKGVKGMPDVIKNINKAANDLYSTAVSKVRQPIESLFNWLIEHTDIQKASKVRSTKGLMVHAFGRLAAAYIILIFNS